METAHIIGLDLGQSQDYTALCVVERHQPGGDQVSYDVRHLQRFRLGTPYPEIVAQLGAMLKTAPMAGGRLHLVADATGVGAPVVELLQRANLDAYLIAVTITAGDAVNRDRNHYRVPKRDLVSATKILLQAGRLRFAELPETPILVKELLGFQVRIDTNTTHDSYSSWREGGHDDLVLALALACWYGESRLSAGWPLQ
jgi:hypothetical protein